MSKKNDWFLQCTLCRPGEGEAQVTTTVWVPEKLAVQGKRLRFTEDEPDGPVWTVKSVFHMRLDREQLDARRDALKSFQSVLVNA